MPDAGKPRRWITETACTLRDVLDRLGEPVEAVGDGRVFVDRKRAKSAGRLLEAGASVDVFPAPRVESLGVGVLARRDDVIAVAKPAGLSTIPDQRGHGASLRDAVARLLGERDATRVHATSRLDREVSGVVIFALGRDARDLLRKAREEDAYQRHYVALALRAPEPARGWVDAPIGRGRRPTERQVGGKQAKEARTRYATVAAVQGLALVAAEPQTGRTHQIRVHMAHVGAPLCGDDRYGGSKRVVLGSGEVVRPGRIMLHAAWVRVQLGGTEPFFVQAPVPDPMRELWAHAAGDRGAWERSLSALDEEARDGRPAAPR